MKRSKIVALLALLAFAAIVVALSLRNRQAPWIPDDAEHAAAIAPADCESCHGHDGVLPRSPDHPIGRDCGRCHAPQR